MAQDKQKQNPGSAGKGTEAKGTDAKGSAAKGSAGQVQGEGDYDAARRYEEKLRDHVEHHDVAKEARDAEPRSQGEARDMERAEEQGKRRAKEEDPLLERPEDIEADAGKPAGGGAVRK